MYAAIAGRPGQGTRRALTPIALLLFVGAVGKSAQLPLYVWLPDAMAGPTPVSALIHAATMVTAGVYMVARDQLRSSPLSPTALLVVAVVGGLTAVFAATIGLAQNDIKKVLAYSTVSQLGYMFLAAGAGAFAAAIFHVFTHAFFKACLFLGSGSVIHACGGEQDMRKMGGLKQAHADHLLDVRGGDAGAGGDPAVRRVLLQGRDPRQGVRRRGGRTSTGYGTVYLRPLGPRGRGAFLTAFYMFRLVHMTFHGEFRGTHEQEHHLHESPATMTVAAAGSSRSARSVVGFLGVGKAITFNVDLNWFEHFLHPVAPAIELEHHASLGVEWLLIALSVGVACLRHLLATRFYFGARRRQDRRTPSPSACPRSTAAVANKYYVDELYDNVIVRPLRGAVALLLEGHRHRGDRRHPQRIARSSPRSPVTSCVSSRPATYATTR